MVNAENYLIKDIDEKIGAVESLADVLDFAFQKQGIDCREDAVDEFRRIACKYRERIIDGQVAPDWVSDGRIGDVVKILSSIKILRTDVESLYKNIRNDFYDSSRSERFLASCVSNNSFESMIGEDEGSRNFLSDVLEKLDGWNEFFKKSVVNEFGPETGSEYFREDAVSLFDGLLCDLLRASHHFKLRKISKSKSGLVKRYHTLHVFNEVFDFCGFRVGWFYPRRDGRKYSIYGMIKARLLESVRNPMCVKVSPNVFGFPAWERISIDGAYFERDSSFDEVRDQVFVCDVIPKFGSLKNISTRPMK